MKIIDDKEKIMKNKHRVLALLISIIMIIGVLTQTVFASETEETEEYCTVSFYMNCAGGKTIPPQKVLYGETISAPQNAIRKGYDFKGWYTQKNGGEKWDFTKPVTSNIKLYAQWTIDTSSWASVWNYGITNQLQKQESDTASEYHNVTFSPNGSDVSNIPEQQKIKDGGYASMPAAPSKSGYVFSGWYTSALCTDDTKYDFSTAVHADITLYAKWVKSELPPVTEGYKFKAFAEDLWTIAVVTEDGNLYCWNTWEDGNLYGQVGNGTIEYQPTPYKVMENVRDVQMDYYRVYALTEDNVLYGWGKNDGLLGDGGTENQYSPVKILDDVEEISISGSVNAAKKTDGSLWCWGFSVSNGKTPAADSMRPVKVLDNVKEFASSAHVVDAITESGELYEWHCEYFSKPYDAYIEKLIDNAASLSNCYRDTYYASGAVITTNGELWCWGYYSGNGTEDKQEKPVKILDNVKSVSGNTNHRTALTNDGHLYAWGFNIGNGETGPLEYVLSPCKIFDNAADYICNESIDLSGALTPNGDMYIWGGELSRWDDDELKYTENMAVIPSPTKVFENASKIYVNQDEACAITADGSLYMLNIGYYSLYDYDEGKKVKLDMVKVLDGVVDILGSYVGVAGHFDTPYIATSDGCIYTCHLTYKNEPELTKIFDISEID